MPSRALTPHEALSLLFAQGKAKFDASILGGFIKMMGVYPPGSAVQLTDERYAIVVSVNSSRPLKPRVLVHDRAVPPDEALLLEPRSRTASSASGAASSRSRCRATRSTTCRRGRAWPTSSSRRANSKRRPSG